MGSTDCRPGDRILAIQIDDRRLTLELADGRAIAAPLTLYPALMDASACDRENCRILGAGTTIEWPALDYHLDVEGILAGRRESPGYAAWRRAHPIGSERVVPDHATRKPHRPRTTKRPAVRSSAALPLRPTSAPAASRTKSVAIRTRKSGLKKTR